MSDPETTQIYVIQHEHGYLKIGKSDDPKDRVKRLQAACPYRLELYTTIHVTGDWHVVERRLHEIYSENNINGEWFELPAKELVSLSFLDHIDADVVKGRPDWTPARYLRRQEGKHGQWLAEGNYKVVQ